MRISDLSSDMCSSDLSHASGSWALALGSNSQATAFGAIALGVSSNATGQFSTATGVYSQATGENSLALGGFLGLSTDNTDLFRFTQATAARAIAVGNAAQVHADEGVALGVKTRVLAGENGRAHVCTPVTNAHL